MDIVGVLKMFGGLGLLMFGMRIMSDGLESAAGDRMRDVLGRLTNNSFKGVLVGTATTAAIQSSTATTLMVIGFVNAGLLQLSQGVGIILGAEIGTTVTAQIIAFEIKDYVPIALFIGVVMVLSKNRSAKRIGIIVTGFGMMFQGMSMLSQAMAPLQHDPAFQQLMVHFQGPVIGILTGMVITGMIQSSAAVIGILQALGMQNLIPLDSAVYVVMGSNIGTCLSGVIASLSTNTNAKRVAIIHVIINVIGAAMISVLMAVIPIVPWLKSLSEGNVSRQIANFHTLFNVASTVLLLPFIPLLVKIAEKLLPGARDQDAAEDEPVLLHLNESVITETPTLAVSLAQEELSRMGRMCRKNFKTAARAFFEKNYELTEKVRRREKSIDYINHEIIRCLVKCSSLDISPKDREIIGAYFHVVGDMERIGDHAENIAGYAVTRIDEKLKFSEEALEELKSMTQSVEEIIGLCLEVFAARDESRIAMVETLERAIDEMQVRFKKNHIDRLNTEACFPKSGVIFTDMISELERAADHATNIAHSIRPIRSREIVQ